MRRSRLARLLAPTLILITLVCFSQAAFGQRRRTQKRTARARRVSRPASLPRQVTVATEEIQLDQEAKREIDAWMESHFVEYNGKRYFSIAKPQESATMDPLERRRQEAALETANRMGMGTTFLQFTELTGMIWTIDKARIAVLSPAAQANGQIVDEWRGTVYFGSDKSPMSRDFQQCGWTQFRDGFRDARGGSLSPITVTKRQGEWHFENKSYESVSTRDIATALSHRTMTTEQLGRAIANYVLTRRCQ